MHRLLLMGLNHSTAPLAVREKLAFNGAQQRAAVEAFRQRFAGCEAVLLSTCNRVELYVAGSSHRPDPEDLVSFLGAFHSIDGDLFRPHLYRKAEREVVNHLFHVATSLDSMVLGESQILGQVRDAYDLAREAQSTGPLLNPLFQRAIAVGKQVMTETALGEGRLSVASVAVDYARRIFDTFADKVVLCIGAGKMATLVLQNFSALAPGKLLICNRDVAKARKLAEKFGGEAVSFDKLNDHLIAADIVVTSTGATEPIITKAQFEKLLRPRRYRPIFMIDIALPRDIEASVKQIDHVYLYDLDHLQLVVSNTQSQRTDAMDAAKKIVAEKVAEFIVWHRKREVGPLIDSWYSRYHKIAQEEVARTLHKLPNVNASEKAHLEELARRIVNKLLHDPIQQLRRSDSQHLPTTAYLHALEKLFHLDDASGEESQDAHPSAESSPEIVPGPREE